MRKSNLGINLLYQIIYQMLLVVLPLITSPYLARVLGVSQLGLFSYTQSIANYFVFLAALGVSTYGTRSIAGISKDKKQRSLIFFEIFSLQLISSFVSLLLYILFIIFYIKTNIILCLIQGILILATLLDINWFYFGLENFRITVTRNLVVKIITVMLILFLVKRPDDVWIYALVMTLSTLFSNLVLWFLIPKLILFEELKQIRIQNIFRHLKPILILFFPLLAIAIYRIMDKTMLGILSTYQQSGYYYNSDKVINIPIGILLGITTVMLPRTTNLIKNGSIKESNNLFLQTIEMIIAISVGMAFGISSISSEFTPIFFGKGYEECIYLIIYMSPLLLIKGLSETFRMQYLIPQNMEKIFTEAVLIGAFLNFFANIFTIPLLGAIGAVLGTTIAELAACIIQYKGIFDVITVDLKSDFKKKVYKIFYYIIFGLTMFLIVRFVIEICGHFFVSKIIVVTLGILMGSFIYISECLIYWKITNNPIINRLHLYISIKMKI